MAIALLILMLLVVYYDARTYTIPNWLCGLVLVLYIPAFFLAPIPPDWQSGLLALALTFAIGYILFSLNWMGGGDVKLFAACALWTGMRELPDFLIYAALMGGALTLALIAARVFTGKKANMPRLLQKGAPVPYGLAIAAAFSWLLVEGRIPAAL